jgi:DNA-binding XRE family transcriptional regulator
MREHIKHQVIEQNGIPLFVLVPYKEYLQSQLTKEVYFPHEVVERYALEDKTLIQAWREYKNLSSSEIAERLGISETKYLQLEKTRDQIDKILLEKIADMFDIEIEQLVLDSEFRN